MLLFFLSFSSFQCTRTSFINRSGACYFFLKMKERREIYVICLEINHNCGIQIVWCFFHHIMVDQDWSTYPVNHILELSWLFVSLEGFVKVFSAWRTKKNPRLSFAWENEYQGRHCVSAQWIFHFPHSKFSAYLYVWPFAKFYLNFGWICQTFNLVVLQKNPFTQCILEGRACVRYE